MDCQEYTDGSNALDKWYILDKYHAEHFMGQILPSPPTGQIPTPLTQKIKMTSLHFFDAESPGNSFNTQRDIIPYNCGKTGRLQFDIWKIPKPYTDQTILSYYFKTTQDLMLKTHLIRSERDKKIHVIFSSWSHCMSVHTLAIPVSR